MSSNEQISKQPAQDEKSNNDIPSPPPQQQRKRGMSSNSKRQSSPQQQELLLLSKVEHTNNRKQLSLFDEELTFRSFIILQESRDIGKVWQSKCDLIATSAYSTSYYRQQKAMTQMKSMIDVSRDAAKEEGARRMNVMLQQEANKRQALELVVEDLERKLHLTSTRELVVTEDLRAKIEVLENKIRADRQLHSTGVQEVKLSANRALAEKAIAQNEVKEALQKVDEVNAKLAEIVAANKNEFNRFVTEVCFDIMILRQEEKQRSDLVGFEFDEFRFIVDTFAQTLIQVENDRQNEKIADLKKLASTVQRELTKSVLAVKSGNKISPVINQHHRDNENFLQQEIGSLSSIENNLILWLKNKLESPLLRKIDDDTNDIEALRNTVIQLAQTSLEQEQFLLHLQNATNESIGSFVKRCNTAEAQVKISKEYIERREKHRQNLFQQSLENLYKEAEMRLPDRVYQERMMAEEQISRGEIEKEFFEELLSKNDSHNKSREWMLLLLQQKDDEIRNLQRKIVSLETSSSTTSRSQQQMSDDKSTQVTENNFLSSSSQTPKTTTFSDKIQICVAAVDEDSSGVVEDEDEEEFAEEEEEEEENTSSSIRNRQLIETMREELHLATTRADVAERKLSVVIQGQLRRARQLMEGNNNNFTRTPPFPSISFAGAEPSDLSCISEHQNQQQQRGNASVLFPADLATPSSQAQAQQQQQSTTTTDDDERMIWAKEFERKYLVLQKEKFDLQRRLDEATAQSAMAEERRVAAVDRKLHMYAEMDALQRKVAEAEARVIEVETNMRRTAAAASIDQQKQQRMIEKQMMKSSGASTGGISALAAQFMLNQQNQNFPNSANNMNMNSTFGTSITNSTSYSGAAGTGGDLLTPAFSVTSFENNHNNNNNLDHLIFRESLHQSMSSQQSEQFDRRSTTNSDTIETPQNLNLLTPGSEDFFQKQQQRKQQQQRQLVHHEHTFSPDSIGNNNNSGDVNNFLPGGRTISHPSNNNSISSGGPAFLLGSGGNDDDLMLYDGIGRVDSVSGDTGGTGSRNASTKMSSLHHQRSVGTGRPGSKGGQSSMRYGSVYGSIGAGAAGSIPFTLRSAKDTSKNQSLLMRVGGASALQKKKGNLGGRVGNNNNNNGKNSLGRVGSLYMMVQQQQQQQQQNSPSKNNNRSTSQGAESEGGHQTPTSANTLSSSRGKSSGRSPTSHHNNDLSNSNSNATTGRGGASSQILERKLTAKKDLFGIGFQTV